MRVLGLCASTIWVLIDGTPLYHAYHDVPWDEPEILKSIVGRNFRFV